MAPTQSKLSQPRTWRLCDSVPRARRAAIAAAVALLVAGCGAAGNPERERPPPDSRELIPRAVQRDVHASLHRLPTICGREVDSRAIERITGAFIDYYERYPSDSFRLQIDDEGGSTLSAILVLRYELSRCSPSSARRVDEVLPRRVRRALGPLEGGRAGRRAPQRRRRSPDPFP